MRPKKSQYEKPRPFLILNDFTSCLFISVERQAGQIYTCSLHLSSFSRERTQDTADPHLRRVINNFHTRVIIIGA